MIDWKDASLRLYPAITTLKGWHMVACSTIVSGVGSVFGRSAVRRIAALGFVNLINESAYSGLPRDMVGEIRW